MSLIKLLHTFPDQQALATAMYGMGKLLFYDKLQNLKKIYTYLAFI